MLLSILLLNIYVVITSCTQFGSVDIKNITADSNVDELWGSFKTTFEKTYKSAEEESVRLQIFTNNVILICKHNEEFKAGLTTYKMGLNRYSDYTTEEFRKMMGLIS